MCYCGEQLVAVQGGLVFRGYSGFIQVINTVPFGVGGFDFLDRSTMQSGKVSECS